MNEAAYDIMVGRKSKRIILFKFVLVNTVLVFRIFIVAIVIIRQGLKIQIKD